MVAIFLASAAVLPVQARDVSTLTAVELYNGPSGPAYVQISEVMINGKDELRACGSEATIDKSAYGKLDKVSLASGVTLEYLSGSGLALTKDGQTTCVVPSNLKFDKNTSPTPAALAERVLLQGKVLGAAAGASNEPPALMPGVKLVFVAEADAEVAEYLRADRASTIALWEDYLKLYPASPHTAAAKQALVSLLTKDGEASLAAYRKALPDSLSYAELRNAKVRSDEALTLVANDAAASHLKSEVMEELVTLTATPQHELDAYKQAVSTHQSGYSHLFTASKLADGALGVDPSSAPLLRLQAEVNDALAKLESSLEFAESLAASQQFDSALAAIADYAAFAGEEPRVFAIVSSAYHFHFDRGQELATAQNWQGAGAEFQKAAQIQNTEEVAAALKKSASGLNAAQNQNAAAEAVKQSQAFASQRQYIQAYEVLAKLPDAQRKLVSAEIDKLEPLYVPSAVAAAKELQRLHDPIHGLADEIAIQRAYEYLRSASELSDDAKLGDKMATLADKLSAYYLVQATRYLNKPLASGVGLGWFYLNKALPYKASNLASVRDEMTKASSAYQVRSKLSIRVAFRDQTSRRDSGGFADQLADAIATGLESGGLLVKVVRPTDNSTLEPNFQLIGDVLDHRRIMVPSMEPKDSKYRAGQHEIPNEEWNKANREYEAVLLEMQSAQKALAGTRARGKKKEIEAAEQRVSETEKKVGAAHTTLDSISKTVSIDIIQPYTYTRKSVDLGAVVHFQFRIADVSGTQVIETVPILRDVHQTFTLLENVKPEDTQGVKAQGTIPDEIQFLTDVEIDARDKLIKAVCERVGEIPGKVLEQARNRVTAGDVEGAAESYILYLNSTPAVQSAKRQEAADFLWEQFNIRSPVTASF